MNRGSLKLDISELKTELRFNEAPIHESGKCGLASVSGRKPETASMRPRFMNRGSAANDTVWRIPASLQ